MPTITKKLKDGTFKTWISLGNFRNAKIKTNCGYCSKEILVYPCQIKNGKGKFCSQSCNRKSKPSYRGMLGKKQTEEFKLNKKFLWLGEKNPNWKGNEVSYRALHQWVERYLGKPGICEFCGKTGLNHKFIHWANKSRRYLRNLDDWLRLCVSCHKRYDAELIS